MVYGVAGLAVRDGYGMKLLEMGERRFDLNQGKGAAGTAGGT